jgi:predicted nucleic acid-binding protein
VSDVVVDTSLSMGWVVAERQSLQAITLLRQWRAASVRLLVPGLFLSEINAALLKRRRAGTMTVADAIAALRALASAVTIIREDSQLTERAFQIADGLGLRNAYDSLYVALAEREGCELWTADERLFNLTAATFPSVRWLGLIAPP